MLTAIVFRKVYKNNKWEEYAEAVDFECPEIEKALSESAEYDQSKVQSVSIKDD